MVMVVAVMGGGGGVMRCHTHGVERRATARSDVGLCQGEEGAQCHDDEDDVGPFVVQT